MRRRKKGNWKWKPFELELPIPLKYFSSSSMPEPSSPFYPLNLIFLFVPATRERGMNENRAHWTQQVRRWKKGAIKAKEKSFLGHKWHEKLSFHLHLLFVTRWEVMKIETYIGISTSMYALLFAIECILRVRFFFIQYCNNPVVLPCWLLFLLNKI